MADHDPYTLLGLSPDAPAEAIRQAYRRRAAVIHPDRQPPERKAAAEEQMRHLNAARDLLLDPARRRAYDRAAGPAAEPWRAAAQPTYPDMWSDAALDRRWRRAIRRSVTVAAILTALFGVAILSVVAPGTLVGLARFLWAAGRVIVLVGSTLIIPLALSVLLAVVVVSLRGSR